MSNDELTIIIPCSGDLALSNCIKSIDDRSTRILVVLNFPTPDVLDIVKNLRVRSIRIDSPSLGEIRQLAIDKVDTPNIMFLDSDCALERNSLGPIKQALKTSEIVKPRLVYEFNSLGTRIVSTLRGFTTYNDIPFLPLAFNRSIKDKIGGYYFRKELLWGEDRDFAMRVLGADIAVNYLQDATIVHSKLTIGDDLRSAYRLGVGRYYQSNIGIFSHRNLLRDLLVLDELSSMILVTRRYGLLAGLYHFLGWRPAYKFGYYQKRIKESLKRTKS